MRRGVTKISWETSSGSYQSEAPGPGNMTPAATDRRKNSVARGEGEGGQWFPRLGHKGDQKPRALTSGK